MGAWVREDGGMTVWANPTHTPAITFLAGAIVMKVFLVNLVDLLDRQAFGPVDYKYAGLLHGWRLCGEREKGGMWGGRGRREITGD